MLKRRLSAGHVHLAKERLQRVVATFFCFYFFCSSWSWLFKYCTHYTFWLNNNWPIEWWKTFLPQVAKFPFFLFTSVTFTNQLTYPSRPTCAAGGFVQYLHWTACCCWWWLWLPIDEVHLTFREPTSDQLTFLLLPSSPWQQSTLSYSLTHNNLLVPAFNDCSTFVLCQYKCILRNDARQHNYR